VALFLEAVHQESITQQERVLHGAKLDTQPLSLQPKSE
jgi:hypothetical protein